MISGYAGKKSKGIVVSLYNSIANNKDSSPYKYNV